MANELKHSSVGTELTQAEWEAVDGHVVNSQAVGDLIYAETTSSLQRLAIGSTNDVLRVTGGKPDWQATSFITSLGTIATGVWQGTDVGVAYGGTGVSTLTDGGVLLGSGASAITAMAVLTDGQMIVGNGSTDPVAESGATLRTSIGVGTGDSPSFTALTLDGDLDFTGPQAITTSSGALTVTPTTDTLFSNGTGVVIGHTAQIVTQELQILGTGSDDSSMSVARWSANSSAGGYMMRKSRGGSIAAPGTTVVDNDILGQIEWFGDDASNWVTGASILARVNGTPGTNDMPTELVFATTADGANSVTERMIIDQAGVVYINDTANAYQTIGLTIQQGANDDNILALKSSDVNTGMTTCPPNASVEVDDYFVIKKFNAASGGVLMESLCEDVVTGGLNFGFEAIGGTAHATKTTAGRGLIEFYASEQDGSNGLANITADGNVFTIRARVGGSDVTRMMVDEDGDLYSVTSAQTFDEYDDAQMVRALDQAKGDVIRDRWDDYVQYNEQALIDAEVLGAPIAEGGLTNVTQLQRLHNGAIWQGYTRQMEMQERIDTLETKLLAIEGGK